MTPYNNPIGTYYKAHCALLPPPINPWPCYEEEVYVNYRPYYGHLLTLNIPIYNPPGTAAKIDYTGSILGYYAGYGDYLEDTYGQIQDDTLLDTLQAEGVSIFTILGFVFACGGCVTSANPGACWGCAGALAAGGTAISQYIRDHLDYFPSGPASSLAGNKLSPFWHFQNTRPYNPHGTSQFDDVDGISLIHQAATDPIMDGVIQYAGGELKIQVLPSLSHGPVSAYQITSGFDGQPYSGSARQSSSYWLAEGRHIGNTTYMPADNMARAQWENWLKMRHSRSAVGSQAGKPYDLTYLGGALHAMQDAAAYHHGTGTLVVGHKDYEGHIKKYFDAEAMLRYNADTKNGSRLIMQWTGAPGLATIDKIKSIVGQLKTYIDQTTPGLTHVESRNDLPIRRLSQKLLQLAQDEHKALVEHDGFKSPLNAEISGEERTAHARVAIPHAIAATIILLVEAANPAIETASVGSPDLPMSVLNEYTNPDNGQPFYELDTDGDGVADWKDYCNFSNASGTGAVDEKGCPLQNSEIGEQKSELRERFRTCVELASPTVEEVLAGATSHDDFITAVFFAKAACQESELGAENGTVDDRFEVSQLLWALRKNFAATRDRLAFRKENACVRASYPEVFPHADYDRDWELCRCRADSDGDGVSDCDDECDFTPVHTTVDRKGCSL